MKAQALFDTVAKHLLTQNMRAVDTTKKEIMCMYRTPDGLKCAAGAVIPDKYYRPSMEGNSIGAVLAYDSKLAKYVGNHNWNLIERLQYIHDTFNPQQWKEKLRETGTSFKLDTTILDQF